MFKQKRFAVVLLILLGLLTLSLPLLVLAEPISLQKKALNPALQGATVQSQAVITDPGPIWTSFFGAVNQRVYAEKVVLDAAGNVYFAGRTQDVITNTQSPVNPFPSGTGTSWAGIAGKLSPSGDLLWHTYFGAVNEDDNVQGLVLANGKLYVAGHSFASWGNNIINPHTEPSGTFQSVDVFLLRLNPDTGAEEWVRFDGQPEHLDETAGMGVDGTGHLYIAGNGSSQMWGNPVMTIPANQSYTGFVAKYNGEGGLVWTTFLTADRFDAEDVAIDANGNSYIVGHTQEQLPNAVEPLPGNNDDDIVVLRINSDGNLGWTTHFGTEDRDDMGRGITLDAAGNVYALGVSRAGWGTPVRPYTEGEFASAFDGAVVKLNGANGQRLWNTFLGSDTADEVYAATVDGFGNLYVTGESSDHWGENLLNPLTNRGGMSVAKLQAASGVLNWTTFLGNTNSTSSDSVGRDVTTASDGSVFLAGYGSDDLWGNPVETAANQSGPNAVIAKLGNKIPEPPKVPNLSVTMDVLTPTMPIMPHPTRTITVPVVFSVTTYNTGNAPAENINVIVQYSSLASFDQGLCNPTPCNTISYQGGQAISWTHSLEPGATGYLAYQLLVQAIPAGYTRTVAIVSQADVTADDLDPLQVRAQVYVNEPQRVYLPLVLR